MPTPPNTDNYTVPAGQKIYFNDGTGERFLGNIAKLDMKHTIETLEHKTNQSGEVLTDKEVPTGRKIEFPFELDEVVLENYMFFFSGGDITTVGDGTATKTDQKLTLPGTNPVSVGAYYALTSVTVRQFLDYVFKKVVAGTFTDNSAEADSLAGTPFELLSLSTDEAYLGKTTPFKEFYSDLAVNGNYGTLAVKYWNGAAWTAVAGLAGAGAAFDGDGKVQFTLPGDWVEKEVNGVTAYFLQITAGTVTTPATVNNFRQNCVLNTDYILIPGESGQTGRVDGKVGRIAAGMLADGEEVKVTFTYATWTSRKMPLSRQGFIQGSARIEIFPSTGLGIQKEYVIPKCQIKPNGDIGLDPTKWETIPLSLVVLADTANNPTEPYGYLKTYDD